MIIRFYLMVFMVYEYFCYQYLLLCLYLEPVEHVHCVLGVEHGDEGGQHREDRRLRRPKAVDHHSRGVRGAGCK